MSVELPCKYRFPNRVHFATEDMKRQDKNRLPGGTFCKVCGEEVFSSQSYKAAGKEPPPTPSQSFRNVNKKWGTRSLTGTGI
jgi:hypothetical protein